MARSRRKSKTPSDRGAFTLVELLVVIVILGLLMALLVPSLRGVWQRYYMTRCQTNLAHIYQAFRHRAAEEAMGAKEVYPVAAWSGMLLPYLENDASQFVCEATAEGDAAPGRPIEELLDELLFVRAEFGAESPSPWDMRFHEGPLCLKLSQTQIDNAIDLYGNYFLTNNPGCKTFVPDNNPYIFWLAMEDHPQMNVNFDYCDLLTQVTDNRDGTVTLKCSSSGTSYSTRLIKRETGEILIQCGGKNIRVFDPITLHVGLTGEPTSYGMNEYAIDKVDTFGKLIRSGVGGAGGKILVMDYSRPVALPDDDKWATDWVFKSAQSGVPNFARHFGMANILFSDGSVHPERPEDIDPYIETFKMKWWEP